MKSLIKFITVCSVAVFFLSACTFGDKGSEKVADSVRIDTVQKSNANSGAAGTGITSGDAVNTGKGTILKDTTATDSNQHTTKP